MLGEDGSLWRLAEESSKRGDLLLEGEESGGAGTWASEDAAENATRFRSVSGCIAASCISSVGSAVIIAAEADAGKSGGGIMADWGRTNDTFGDGTNHVVVVPPIGGIGGSDKACGMWAA